MRRLLGSFWIVLLIAASAVLVRAQSCALPIFTVPASFFGMHEQSTTNPNPNAQTFGIWRLWDSSCVWTNVNPSAGTFSYSTQCKAQVDYAVSRGARPDFVFGRTPHWAISGGLGGTCTGSFGSGCAQAPAGVNTGNAEIVALVNSLVASLASDHPGVHWIFECVNEANLVGEWANAAGSGLGSMSELVKYCTDMRNAAHAADSQILVLGPSGDSLNSGNVHLYSDGNNYQGQTGAAASLDAVSFHPYLYCGGTDNCDVPESLIAAMPRIHDLVKSGSPLVGKAVYATETDWGGVPTNGTMTATQKRQYLPRSYMIMFAFNISGSFWYQYDNHPTSLSAGFGTLCEAGPPCTPNQAATAYANLNSWLIGATYSGTVGDAGVTTNGPCTVSATVTSTCLLQTSPASTGAALIFWHPTGSASLVVSSVFTKVLNWDGSNTPIVAHTVTATQDVAMAVP